VTDRATGTIETPADYSALGWLLIVVAVIAIAAPLLTIVLVQLSPLRTNE
jgi:hypothetical protein